MSKSYKLNKDNYKDLLLTDFVEAKVKFSVDITINRIYPVTEENAKKINVQQGDLIEVICLNDLDLRYYYGKVVYIDYNTIKLDISNECESKEVCIAIKDIRDIEKYQGDNIYKLLPELENIINENR